MFEYQFILPTIFSFVFIKMYQIFIQTYTHMYKTTKQEENVQSMFFP